MRDDLLFRLAVYLKNYRKECIIGPLFKFIEAVTELLLPTLMAVIINEGVLPHNKAVIYRMGGLMALLACFGYCCALTCQFLAARASQGFGTDVRNAVFEKIAGFSFAHTDQFGTPTLINRITNDVSQLQVWVAMMIRLLIRAPFICIGSLIMAMILDLRLSLILFAAMPFLAAIIYFITAKASPLYRRYQRNLDRLGLLLRESLSGVRVIRAFAKTGEHRARFGGANDELTGTGLAIGRLSALFNPLTSLVVNAAILLILWFGGLHIEAGRLSQGQIIAYISYVNQILYALLVVSNLIVLLTKTMASAARVNEVLDVKPDMTDGTLAAASENEPDAPAIRFSDVSFGYNDTGERALSHVSVSIARGETVGIIGGTGAGKSTFVSLISRFYDAGSGSVEIDGINVKALPRRTLNRLVGIVPQKAVLFTGTVADNIRWGDETADDEAVREAAVTAQADEFIVAMPEGYGSPVERDGKNLSGGQRQRLTIARALIAKPQILILDDASSALDFATDARLRAALTRESRERGTTVLIVSQRVGTVKNADRILVFDNGRLCAQGTHAQLFETSDHYRQLCLSQLTYEEAAK